MICGPDGDSWGHVRSIGAVNDGGRWTFDLVGEPQDFEDEANYIARRKRDRFTSTLLQQYCRAMGVDLFNPDLYGPKGALVESLRYIDKYSSVPAEVQPRRSPVKVMTLAEAQARRGIEPGEARRLPG